jgi:hypothetical protein
MKVKGGTIGKKLLHLPDQGIVCLGHLEGNTAGFRSGQAKMFRKMTPDEFNIIRGQAP